MNIEIGTLILTCASIFLFGLFIGIAIGRIKPMSFKDIYEDEANYLKNK